jgi:hypothetical protein
MRYYLAGPMSGYPDHNYPAFHAAAAAMRSIGLQVVNPAELDDPGTWPGSWPWHVYLRRDLGLLVTCEGIVLLPGWQRSRGARLERYVAMSLGMTEISLAEVLER